MKILLATFIAFALFSVAQHSFHLLIGVIRQRAERQKVVVLSMV